MSVSSARSVPMYSLHSSSLAFLATMPYRQPVNAIHLDMHAVFAFCAGVGGWGRQAALLRKPLGASLCSLYLPHACRRTVGMTV